MHTKTHIYIPFLRDTVDVLHLDSMTWRPGLWETIFSQQKNQNNLFSGTPLPIELQGPAAMQTNEDFSSFIIIGGGITDR